jgi:hypothetical protein
MPASDKPSSKGTDRGPSAVPGATAKGPGAESSAAASAKAASGRAVGTKEASGKVSAEASGANAASGKASGARSDADKSSGKASDKLSGTASRESSGARPASPKATAKAFGARRHRTGHPCLDPESGFFREEHFELSLKYEMARSLEAEKPLGLLVVSFNGALPGFFAAFLRERLRRIDLPSRLGPGEIAVIMPRVNPSRAGRLVERLGADLADRQPLDCGMPLFGAALAWPNGTLTAEGLLAKAMAAADTAAATAERLMSGKGPYAEAETELVAEEKETLFAGFSLLRGSDPAGGGGGNGPQA